MGEWTVQDPDTRTAGFITIYLSSWALCHPMTCRNADAGIYANCINYENEDHEEEKSGGWLLVAFLNLLPAVWFSLCNRWGDTVRPMKTELDESLQSSLFYNRFSAIIVRILVSSSSISYNHQNLRLLNDWGCIYAHRSQVYSYPIAPRGTEASR